MQRFLSKRSWYQRLSSFRRGLAYSTSTVGLVAAFLAVTLVFFASNPSDSLLADLANLGAVFLVGYAVETAWVVRAMRAAPVDDREERLGTMAGFGAAGLTGIMLGIFLAERVRLGHWIWIDEILFAWVVASTLFLGLFVVLQPVLTHEWLGKGDEPID